MAKKGPKEPDWPDWLFNQAAHYLGRHGATEAHLAEILRRKIVRKRHKMSGGEGFPNYREALPDSFDQHIETAVTRCRSLGYVDDQAYAASRFRSLQRKGWPIARIRSDLRHKGVPGAIIISTLEPEGDGETIDQDLKAAVSFARRRRFGAYARLSLTGVEKPMEKQLAAFVRAGFRRDMAMKVLEAEEPEDLLDPNL